MSFPAGLTLVTVHGRLDTLPNGGAAGMIRFASPSALQGSVDNSIVPYIDVTVGLDSSGEFTTQLPATNAASWAPSGWAYTVTINLGVRTVTGTLQLDAANTSVELADLFQPDGAAEAGQTYILLSQKGVYGGVAALDADTGEVLDGDGNPVTGGGGGGTPSATVVSETAYGQSASAGNASAYSRGNHTHGTPAAPAAADISDATTVGRNVLKAADAAAARTAIGAGTSSLALGTTGSTAAAGNDSRLSDARTPTTHASSHADGGSDEVALDGSQITTGTVAIGRLPTGTSSVTVALGNHDHTGVYQPLDSDLTTIAGLTATTDNMLQAVAGAWASRTPAQVRTALTLLPAILLGPVDAIPGGTPANTLVIRTT